MKLKNVEPSQIVRQWDIEGFPMYFFGADKQLYRIDSRGHFIINRRLVKRYTHGYILKSKFYSLAQLRPLLCRHNPTDHPMDF